VLHRFPPPSLTHEPARQLPLPPPAPPKSTMVPPFPATTSHPRLPSRCIEMSGQGLNSPYHQSPSLTPLFPTLAINGVKALGIVVTAPATPPWSSPDPYKRLAAPLEHPAPPLLTLELSPLSLARASKIFTARTSPSPCRLSTATRAPVSMPPALPHSPHPLRLSLVSPNNPERLTHR
jgi:hypothetical protein